MIGATYLSTIAPEQEPFNIHDLSVDDLVEVNGIVAAAIESWDIAPRVKRLTLTSLLYKEDDFKHLAFVGLSQHGKLLGITSVELDVLREVVEERAEVLLHGLYVSPNSHRLGVGTALVKAAKAKARSLGAGVLRVRAERNAVRFFKKQGFVPLPVEDEKRDYPHELAADLAP